MNAAIETKAGRFYIAMGVNGFNLPANNAGGYATEKKALTAAKRCGYSPALEAAKALDLTHTLGERGPRTFAARMRVAAWLDAGEGTMPPRGDVEWMLAVARKEG